VHVLESVQEMQLLLMFEHKLQDASVLAVDATK